MLISFGSFTRFRYSARGVVRGQTLVRCEIHISDDELSGSGPVETGSCGNLNVGLGSWIGSEQVVVVAIYFDSSC